MRTRHLAGEASTLGSERIQQERLYEQLVANSQSGIYLVQHGEICFVNPQVVKWTGFDEAELLGMNSLQLVHPKDRESVRQNSVLMLKSLRSEPYEYRIVTKNGVPMWVLETVASVQHGGKRASLGSWLPMTAQKQAEQRVVRLNRVWAVLSGINELSVRLRDPERLFEQACRMAVERGGFLMVWVGMLDRDALRVNPAAHWGFEEGYLDKLEVSVVAGASGCGPMGSAIREGRHYICGDIEHDSGMAPWRVEAMKRGYRSSAAFPLRIGAKVVGGINVISAEPHFFDEEEVRLLDELAADISFALESIEGETGRRRAESRLQRNMEVLRRVFEGTIQAMALAAEVRDPYTAGHQHRVAQISQAIAREIGLSESRIEGVRMAALVHDVGKISVPSEILCRPGVLTDMEFGLIKTHPQIGYNILKGIEFPWPVAEIVYQHHERIDGSGYPRGLTDDSILMEARVLGIADVVEAMSSHRPYRLALGRDKALEEIRDKRGILYDAKGVDVCLKVFPAMTFENGTAQVAVVPTLKIQGGWLRGRGTHGRQ